MMGTALTITWNIDKDDLVQRIQQERNPFTLRRLQAILLLFEHTVPKAAAILGRSERTLRDWLGKFNRSGPAGLANKPRPGQPPKLAVDLVEDFKERVRKGARGKDDVCALRGPDIRRILVKEYDAEYSLGGVYFLLHRLGFSSLVPRPQHPKADPAAQDDFKKTSCRRR